MTSPSTSSAAGARLSFDDALPFRFVAPFFLAAPVALALAAFLLVLKGEPLLASPWHPATVALTHLGTIGFLMMVMVGAFQQMIPVVAGARLVMPGLVHVVFGVLVTSTACFFYAGWTARPLGLFWGALGAGGAVLLFVPPTLIALLRSPSAHPTVRGMSWSLGALLGVAALGTIMAQVHGGGAAAPHRGAWIQLHMTLAFVGWVGGLITAISWQVVPMFYLAGKIAADVQRAVLSLIVVTVLALPLVAALPLAGIELGPAGVRWAGLVAGSPGALAVWGIHPLVILHYLSHRRRRRPDATRNFWQASMSSSLLLLPLSGFAFFSEHPRGAFLFGWVCIWGWAGLLIHGMLHRIVPFLVWLHELSPLVGRGPLPTTRQLLPNQRTRWGLRLHLLSLGVGVAAIAWPHFWTQVALGGALFVVGLSLAHSIVTTAWRGRAARLYLLRTDPPERPPHEH